ncbi:hypothetical protein bcgnr5378_06530 [Bacillus cereus]|uniref:DUF3137 domain-containing protein n=1 Tax=Bacillus cereus TaxID=1396 RepID=A0A164L9V6_BACCE|nr:hypothetical protein [Bacillus cereus]KZD55585.1 hypothetical protein B4088_5330 [Bacillus cereus]
MDFETLKRTVNSSSFTPEQSELLHSYNRKNTIASICYASSFIGLISCMILILAFDFTASRLSFHIVFPAIVISFLIGFFISKTAGKGLREALFLPLLNDFLPGFSVNEELISLQTWNELDEYGAYPGNSIQSGAAGEIANYIFYQNENIQLNFQNIKVGKRKRDTENRSSFHSYFEGTVGHFALRHSIQEPFSVYLKAFYELSKDNLKYETNNKYKKFQDKIKILNTLDPNDHQTFTLPLFLQNTALEHFLYAYADHFNHSVQLVVKQNELFIYESKRGFWDNGRVPTLQIYLFQTMKEDEIRNKLLHILSYVAIAEEIIKIDNAK